MLLRVKDEEVQKTGIKLRSDKRFFRITQLSEAVKRNGIQLISSAIIVSLEAVVSLVTQEERCVTRLKTAVGETSAITAQPLT